MYHFFRRSVGAETWRSAQFRRVETRVAHQPLYKWFLSSVGAETWRSSGGVYAPEAPKVSAPNKFGINTEAAGGGKTRVSTAQFRRVETRVAHQPLYEWFLSSVGTETWRSSGGVYAPEDPEVSAPNKFGVNTEAAGGETRVSTARFRRVETLF
jgi:hypothetical protein